MRKRTIWSGLFFLMVLFAYAQEPENNTIQNVFKGTRFINGQSANLAEAGELQLQIQHRFGDISGGMYEFFGLDLATMRLGFEYGVSKNFTAGIGRSDLLKTYDALLKFRLSQQSDNFPVTIVATAEGSIPTVKDLFPASKNNFSDKVSESLQLNIAKTIGILGLQVSPGYLHTGYLFIENNDFDLFTLGLGSSLKLSKHLSVNAEYLNPFESKLQANKPLSFGVDLSTGGHLFQLMVTNSQALINQGLYTNTYGDWGKGHIYLGFNLIRKFKLRYTDEDNY